MTTKNVTIGFKHGGEVYDLEFEVDFSVIGDMANRDPQERKAINLHGFELKTEDIPEELEKKADEVFLDNMPVEELWDAYDPILDGNN